MMHVSLLKSCKHMVMILSAQQSNHPLSEFSIGASIGGAGIKGHDGGRVDETAILDYFGFVACILKVT